jgi:predicted AAA+ superfamily ATPase
MIPRPFWHARIEAAWREAPIAWLSGFRRSGKTTLVESLGLDRLLYVNCDLPMVEEKVRDPLVFFRNCSKPVVAFDEVYQLRDPAFPRRFADVEVRVCTPTQLGRALARA